MTPPRPLAGAVALLTSVLLGLSTGLSSAAGPTAGPTAGPAAGPTAGPSTPSPVAVAPPATSALLAGGSTADGWPVSRLADDGLPAALPAGTGFRGEIRFAVAGTPRAVRLVVPPTAPAPAPLLVALPGLYQTTSSTERAQGWEPLARREGVVLAYGVGSGYSWNAGTCCGRAAARGVDDLAYLDRVVALAGALHPVDPRRLHLTGFSNGAMMAYRYACARPDKVAGVLAVAGTVTASCRGRSDVAVLAVHGKADRTVPLGGLAWSGALATSLRPVSATARMFGPTISARVLPGVGHGWPTRSADGFDTTGAGWAFLAAHPRSD